MADLMLYASEEYFFKPYVWGTTAPVLDEGHWLRQFVSLWVFVAVGAVIMYFALAGMNYVFLFDKKIIVDFHIEGQIEREIKHTLEGVPLVSFLTTIVFIYEVRGYSQLYDRLDERSMAYTVWSVIWFLIFTDMFVYFVHRGLHDISWAYQNIHKPHHQWKVTTPFASHAFHPVDGFLQGLAYHVFAFLFPLNKVLYLVLYVLVNVWTVSIHDCQYLVPSFLKGVINGAAHHTDHHARFTVNYGQYTTLWDRLGGTYYQPEVEKDNYSPKQKTQKAMLASKKAA